MVGLPEADRPAKVIFAVVTDGEENASKEFTKAQIVQMIRDRRPCDASMYYRKPPQGTAKAFSSLSTRTTEYRKGKKHFVGFEEEDAQDPEE